MYCTFDRYLTDRKQDNFREIGECDVGQIKICFTPEKFIKKVIY